MKNKITYLPIGILTLTTALAGVSLSSTGVAADTSGSRDATVTVGASCTFTGTTSYTASISVYAGNTSESDTSRAPYSISCNNPTGFKVQAIGFSDNTDGDTDMHAGTGSETIATGSTGPSSYWGFRIGFAYATAGTATVETGYNTYTSVPSSATDVISFSGSTASVVTGLFRPDYQIYVAPSQAAGTYSGAVKYTLVPNA